MKQILLADMDGVIAGFDEHFWNEGSREGYRFDITAPHLQEKRYFTDHILDKKHRAAARRLIERPGWFESLPVIPGAVDGLHKLSEVFDVWICTKPLERNPTCRDAKAGWLEKNGFKKFVNKLIIAPDKSMIRGSILLDDAPKIEWIDKAEWEPVIFSTTFNGVGSVWEQYHHWDWSMSLEQLTEVYKRNDNGVKNAT